MVEFHSGVHLIALLLTIPSREAVPYHMLSMIPAWLTTVSQIGLYLWLYTGYSKQDQRYDTALIREVLMLEKGLHHTVLELNKIIALAGLTALLCAFFAHAEDFVSHAQWLLLLHAALSTWKYYGDTKFPIITSFGSALDEWRSKKSKDNAVAVKKASIVLAVFGQIILAAGHLGYMSLTGASFALLSLGFGFAHFWTMEVDFKYKLGVRPAGLFPFVLGPLALLAVFLL